MKLHLYIIAILTAGNLQTTVLQATPAVSLLTGTTSKSFANYTQNEDVFPKSFILADGTSMKLYTIQPSSIQNNQLQAIAAVSFLAKGATDPTFGTIWLDMRLQDNGSSYSINAATISNLKFPDDLHSDRIAYFKTTLETKLPQLGIVLNKADLQESVNTNMAESNLSNSFNNNAPSIIYSNKPAILVIIDGAPSFQKNEVWGVDVVVNSPYTIIKNSDNKYYLFGEKRWFSAPAATGPYTIYTSYNAKLKNIEKALLAQNADNPGLDVSETNGNAIPTIIVQTKPAELIQTNREPNFSPIAGTSLLYADNSSNDIFMDINAQKYYLLLAGRWYQSNSLKQPWNYIDPELLPTDFSRIPEGSPKDNVLANVAGTEAANEAVLDAQVPVTAKVSRTKTLEQISYDGAPSFETINGTALSYAVNTATSVLKWKNRYYAVDNGIWFESKSANGPWYVATKRPKGVELIAPSYPVYNVKYVYIYDISPDYIYMGYTPGYLNTYVLGRTIVYGTGYHYTPWQGRYYFPRPWTWGFNIWYNPWAGWSFGGNVYRGWFFNSFYNQPRNIWRGSWWGPSYYRPAYGWNGHNAYRNTGYYGAVTRNNFRKNQYPINHGNQFIQYNQTNIYINRTNVVSKSNVRSNGKYASQNGNWNRQQEAMRPNRSENVQNNNQRMINRGDHPVGNNGNIGGVTRPNRAGNTINTDVNNSNKKPEPGATTRPSINAGNGQGANNSVNSNDRKPGTIIRPNNTGNTQGTSNRIEQKNPSKGTVSRPYNPVTNGNETNKQVNAPANNNNRPTTRPSNMKPVNKTDNNPVNSNTIPGTRPANQRPIIKTDNSGGNTNQRAVNRSYNSTIQRSNNSNRENSSSSRQETQEKVTRPLRQGSK